MLSGFANNNRGFMNRTRAINQNFANAIGSTTKTKECAYQNVIVGYSPTGSGEPIIERRLICKTPTAKFDGGFANISGSKDFASATLQNGQVLNIPKRQYPYAGTGCSNSKCPKGYSCVWSKMAGVNYWTYNCIPNEWLDVKFDGGFDYIHGGYANAIGSGKLIDPKILGYTPKKCSAGSCPTGLCCLRNGTLVSTGETANWCISCAEFSKFDGGFDYIHGGFNSANGDNGFLGL